MLSHLKVTLGRYFWKTPRDYEHGFHKALDAAVSRRWCRYWPLFLFIPATLYFYMEVTGPQHSFSKLTVTPYNWSIFKMMKVEIQTSVTESHASDYDEINKRSPYKIEIKTVKTSSMPTTSRTTTTDINTPYYCSSISTTKSPTTYKLDLSNITESLDDIYPMVHKGGYYKPGHCISKHKVAILVPYRHRSSHLTTFLYNIHPFLMAQRIEYQIFVIEQYGDISFNKGRLYNAGFSELFKSDGTKWTCLVLHNVDLLPASLNVSYACPAHPRRLSCSIVGDLKKNPKRTCDGVCILTVDQYKMANGYSNMYWELGGEDIDFSGRLNGAGLQVMWCNKRTEQYIALAHKPRLPRPYNRMSRLLLYSAKDRRQCEGLKTAQYKLLSVEKKHLYTRLLVDVDQYGELKELHFKDVIANT